MWAETFPDAEIYGLDYDPSTMVNLGNIKSYLCDQSKEADLVRCADLIGDEIDFIVDDGSHKPFDQILTAEIFVPLLSDTGVYVIEDRTCCIARPRLPG
jgi:hypothetical protein